MRSLLFLLLPLLTITLTACPIGEEYPLDEPGKTPIDTNLLGTWARISNQENDLKKIKISKATLTSNAYDIRIQEEDSPSYIETKYTGYFTRIDGKKFVYASSEEEEYYAYCYEIKDGELYIWNVSLPEDAEITSTKSFRKAISAALKKPGSLINKAIYGKE